MNPFRILKTVFERIFILLTLKLLKCYVKFSYHLMYFIDQLFYTYENSTMVIGQFDHVSLLSFHSFLHLIFVPF